MNKKTIILLSALALVIATFFILNKDNTQTLNTTEKDFGFKSTDKIDKIFMTNIQSKEFVLLTKVGKSEWRLNDKYDASTPQVDAMLETMRKIQVKKPVAKDVVDAVVKQMIIRGTKVEFYEAGKLSKVFYVGNNTPDDLGTYFYMENAKEPFICHVPGFNGFLGGNFFTSLEAWRSKVVFKTKEEDIAEIDVDWLENPSASFKLDNKGKEPILMIGAKSLQNNVEVNLNKIKSYLKSWEYLCYEGFPIDLDPHKIDSIAHTKPIVILKLTDKNGRIKTLTVHRKGLKADSYQQVDDEGKQMAFEIENYYAFVDDNKTEIVQIQDFVFGKVMKQVMDFELSKTDTKQ